MNQNHCSWNSIVLVEMKMPFSFLSMNIDFTYAVQDKIISEQLTFKYFFSNTTVYIALEDMEYSTHFIWTIFDSYYSLFWS